MKRVADLDGPELDFWVAKALGLNAKCARHTVAPELKACIVDDAFVFDPHREWKHAGPIIEEQRIALMPHGDTWSAIARHHFQWRMGGTALLAAMRCFVASVYGERVPDLAGDTPEDRT